MGQENGKVSCLKFAISVVNVDLVIFKKVLAKDAVVTDISHNDIGVKHLVL